MVTPSVPPHVLSAYGFAGDSLSPITIGLINQTHRVERAGKPIAVLQRLHPIFDASVNQDLEALARQIWARGLACPQLLRTESDAREVLDEGAVWRALSFIEGRTLTEVRSPAIAYAAGVLAGRFAAALEGVDHTFQFTRAGVHDTERHLAGLETAMVEHGGASETEGLSPLATSILEHARSLPALPVTRRRIVHGDLKITNLMFEPERDVGLAVVDLDTMAHGTLPVELGDALRSWCNPAGESSDGGIVLELFDAALRGFVHHAALDDDERDAIVLGVETITIELASRFARDAYEDRYFGWDSSRYPSRRAHCRARAQSQLTLARSISRSRGELERIARAATSLEV